MREYDNLILGKNAVFPSDSSQTGLNNNLCVIGGSGSGKSHSVVKPNLLEIRNASVILSDPKGALEKEFTSYYKGLNYNVYSVDLINPEKSRHGVNLMYGLSKDQDYIKLAHRIVYSDKQTRECTKQDPYFNQMSEILLSSLIAMVHAKEKKGNATFDKVIDYLTMISRDEIDLVNDMFMELAKQDANCFAVTQWIRFLAIRAAEKTWSCVVTSLTAILGRYGTTEMRMFFSNKNCVDFNLFAEKKCILFLKVSDCDDMYHNLANIIYSQALEYLCSYADAQEDGRCKVPVKFIFDDFATNVVITEFPKILSVIRARDISAMLVLQSIHQLRMAYGEDANTILADCDSLVFCGGCNCVETAKDLSIRLDKPVTDVLYQKRGNVSIFRVGMRPMEVERYDYREHPNFSELSVDKGSKHKYRGR